MARSTSLVFFGSDDFSLVILKGLASRGYDIGLVVTSPAADASTGPEADIREWSKRHGIELFSPVALDDTAVGRLTGEARDFAVLASYGKLLPASVLKLFGVIVNVHPSLLPKWRGPSPVEAAILSGEAKTGVSLMKLVEKMDAGPVYAQAEHRLSGQEDQAGLRNQLAELGRDLLLDKLPDIVNKRLPAIPQSEDQATYCGLITKRDGQLDWNQPADLLERKVRAYARWPKARAQLFGRDVIITQAETRTGQGRVGDISSIPGEIVIQCGQDRLLVQRLKPAGRVEMSAAEFLRGLPA